MSGDYEGLDKAMYDICAERAEARHEAEQRKAAELARKDRIRALREAVKTGEYRPDVMDIARLITSALDPAV